MASISVRIVAPVVVKPDMVSKKASVKEGIAPPRTKGRAPKTVRAHHPKTTTANPSRSLSSSGLRVIRARIPPVARVIIAAVRIAWMSPSP